MYFENSLVISNSLLIISLRSSLLKTIFKILQHFIHSRETNMIYHSFYFVFRRFALRVQSTIMFFNNLLLFSNCTCFFLEALFVLLESSWLFKECNWDETQEQRVFFDALNEFNSIVDDLLKTIFKSTLNDSWRIYSKLWESQEKNVRKRFREVIKKMKFEEKKMSFRFLFLITIKEESSRTAESFSDVKILSKTCILLFSIFCLIFHWVLNSVEMWLDDHFLTSSLYLRRRNFWTKSKSFKSNSRFLINWESHSDSYTSVWEQDFR